MTRHHARVVEAMVLLVLAKALVHHVPLRWWRGSLGRIGGAASGSNDMVSVRRVVRAVLRATEQLSGDYVCLPRAMAVQWMLRRRGHPSSLVFGILPGEQRGDIHALHAWVECGDETVIGGSALSYFRGLVLTQ